MSDGSVLRDPAVESESTHQPEDQGISLYLVSLGQSSTKDVVGLAVGTLIFWLVGGLTLHSRIPKHASITHTQYGIANGKWPSPARSGNTNGRTYYLDVIFPDTGTRIQKVICSYGDYKRAEQGQQVLTVVFENRNQAFGILLLQS